MGAISRFITEGKSAALTGGSGGSKTKAGAGVESYCASAQGPRDTGQHVQRRQRETQRGGYGRDFRQKHRARANGQNAQHKNVAAVRKCRFPTQHGEQTDHQHGGRDQKVLHGPGADHMR